MTLSITHSADRTSPAHGLLPLWVGVGVYALLVVTGNRLLLDPDTLWHITVGQWMLDHHAVPHTDIYSFTMRGHPWISMQWVSEVLYAEAYALFGWSGPVVLTAAATRADLCVAGEIPEPASEPKRHDCVRRRGIGADGAAFAGAAACAGAPGHGGLGRRTD